MTAPLAATQRLVPTRLGQPQWLAMLLWCVVCAVTPARAANPELLLPEQAFLFHATPISADMVRAEWIIAQGYYLYRDKIRFEGTGEARPDNPVLPPPHAVKEDKFFGRQGIYRNRVTLDVPIRRPAVGPVTLVLKASAQGCADAGVCYPPETRTVTLALPPPSFSTPSASNKAANTLRNFLGNLGITKPEKRFLEPDQAFVFTAEATGPNLAVAHWTIADGYHLYRNKFKFAVRDNSGARVGQTISPPGRLITDEALGQTEAYYHEAVIRVPIARDVGAPDTLTLEAQYQGCADAGLCYPPITKTIAMTLPTSGAITKGNPPADDAIVLPEQDRIATTLAKGNRLVALLGFFGFGLLLSFTPCMFPMIPILSSLIVGQGANATMARSFGLSLSYVLAMAFTYTAAGVLVGLSGANLQAAFQNPWVIGIFSALFVALALAMFGLYQLQLPTGWQTRLTTVSNRQKGGTWVGAAVMGLLSALIVGPCMAAPLAGALIYIGQSGDALLGGMALFALSLGMGTPLLGIGITAGRWLPKAGGWMNTVKSVFGVVLLGLAIWMLERILPAHITLSLWAALLIVIAVHMGAADRLVPEASGWSKLWKGVGLVLFIYGSLLLAGAAAGGKDVLQPLRGVTLLGKTATADTSVLQQGELHFITVKGIDGLARALAQANAKGQSAMLDFYADWCVSCKEMERNTFSDPGVRQTLAGVTLLRADVTSGDAEDTALLKHYGLFGPPSILFFNHNGQEQRHYRLVGYLNALEFKAHAVRALNHDG